MVGAGEAGVACARAPTAAPARRCAPRPPALRSAMRRLRCLRLRP